MSRTREVIEFLRTSGMSLRGKGIKMPCEKCKNESLMLVLEFMYVGFIAITVRWWSEYGDDRIKKTETNLHTRENARTLVLPTWNVEVRFGSKTILNYNDVFSSIFCVHKRRCPSSFGTKAVEKSKAHTHSIVYTNPPIDSHSSTCSGAPAAGLPANQRAFWPLQITLWGVTRRVHLVCVCQYYCHQRRWSVKFNKT